MDLIQFEHYPKHNIRLFSPDEAINLGNLFKDLYMSYNGFSNYCYSGMNEKTKLLFEIQKYCFCAHELNLYLDNNKNNCELFELYNQYKNKADKLTCLYEEKYGPLSVDASKCERKFNWIKGPWPWERQ